MAVILLLGVGCSYFSRQTHEVDAAPLLHEEYQISISDPENAEALEYLPQGSGEIVRHTFFVLSFNSEHRQANWVYYSPGVKKNGISLKRTNNFREDNWVRSGSAKPSDYAKSGYDRGHLCPAGDMMQSIDAMSETFYMSNISPQIPGFNRGIWKSLEEEVRKWGKREQIYVVTGPVFRDNKGQIGQRRVTVPGYYYKVVYAPVRQQMIGFILPHGKSCRKWMDYIVSVDSVENFTGIDFFPQLSDSLEDQLEACSDYEKWK